MLPIEHERAVGARRQRITAHSVEAGPLDAASLVLFLQANFALGARGDVDVRPRRASLRASRPLDVGADAEAVLPREPEAHEMGGAAVDVPTVAPQAPRGLGQP